MCAKVDQSTGVRWYAGTVTYTMALGDGPLAGKMNTAIIIANQGIGDAGTYAARICNESQITERIPRLASTDQSSLRVQARMANDNR